MTEFVAALPMYDWPETRAETDAEWGRLREVLQAAGIEAPDRLARCNRDLPPVPGGIRDDSGVLIAPDPASLPPEGFDLPTLWRHPRLLLAQACWGPLELGLAKHARVIFQPSYDAYEGGEGEYYSSVIVMRKGEGAIGAADQSALPVHLFMRRRFAFNNPDSMSGLLALARDLEAAGCGVEIFSAMIETGSHRNSVIAVAEGRADLAAIDCRTWALIRRFEPKAAGVQAIAWTARRKGLPLIASRQIPEAITAGLHRALREVYGEQGSLVTA